MSLGVQFPREPRPGEPLDVAWGIAVVRCLRMIALMPGVGYLLKRTLGGTALEITGQGGGAAQLEPPAFTLLNKSTTSDDTTTLKVGFQPGGRVNGLIPTLGGAALWQQGNPAYVQPTITVTAERWFWLKCVGTFGNPDSYVVTIESTPNGTPPAAESITGTGFVSCWLLGTALVSAGVLLLFPTGAGSKQVESFGAANFWWNV